MGVKVEQVLSREDGSQARVVMQEMFGLGLERTVDCYVQRRASPTDPWVTLSDQPAPTLRAMSVDQHIKVQLRYLIEIN